MHGHTDIKFRKLLILKRLIIITLNSGFYSQGTEHTCFVLTDDVFQKQLEFLVKIVYQWTGNRVAYGVSYFLSPHLNAPL